jgi:tight adherence protein C
VTAGVATLLLALALVLAGAVELLRGRDRPGRFPSGEHAGGVPPGKLKAVPAAALNLGLPDRIRRAGRSGILSPRSVLAAKAAGAAAGALFGLALSPFLPGRFGSLVPAALGSAGFLLPDLLLERAARRRHRRLTTALPDALDLLAVSVATGRGLGGSLADLARSGRGPLVDELGEVSRDLAWGKGQAAALEGLRERVGGPEVAGLCAILERSRRLGSPLAEQLRRHSSGLRRDQKRVIEEDAARAAPKIQLVVALLLVPSVLLLIVAALIANSDTLLGPAF